MTTLPEIIGALVSDAVTIASTAAGSPIPGALVGGILSEYLRRRAAEARDILIEELRRGEATEAHVASQDDAIAVIWRFLRASTEGTARLNMRLLARAIVGRLQLGRLVADEFLQYAEAIGSLSRDEIIVLGTMYKYWRVQQASSDNHAHEAGDPNRDPWEMTLVELTKRGMTEELASTVASRAQRSGLLYPKYGRIRHAAARYGDLSFLVSPLLVDLGRTVDFEDALQREASQPG
jgi:hypothetical protein